MCVSLTASAPDILARQLGMAPAPIGLQPNCDTTCGDIRVPYPFGITSGCYLPGFDLLCDKSHHPPRLFLNGNSILQVIGISLSDSTVRVIHTNTFNVTISTDQEVLDSRGVRFENDDKQISAHFPKITRPYILSDRNEFILTGCNIEATLLGVGEYRNTTESIITSCVSRCSSSVIGETTRIGKEYCSGRDGCCHARIPLGSLPKKVKFKRLPNKNTSQENYLPPLAFIAEEGQINQWYTIFNGSAPYYIRQKSWARNVSTVRQYMASKVPLVLRWAVQQEVRSSVTSDCRQENGIYTCHCKKGYYGNPYIGCQGQYCYFWSYSDHVFHLILCMSMIHAYILLDAWHALFY